MPTDKLKKILSLGKRYSSNIWTEIVKQVDSNSVESVTYEEFLEMLIKLSAIKDI